MTWTAVGSLIQATSSTFTLDTTGASVGDLIMLQVLQISNNTVLCTGVSSSNVTWTKQNALASAVYVSGTSTIFTGKVTAQSSQTVTVSWSGTTPATIRIMGRVFHTSLGFWQTLTGGTDYTIIQAVDNNTGTNTWANVGPPYCKGLVYWGACIDTATATAGSTTGFTYEIDAHSNGEAYALNWSANANPPVWGDAHMVFGQMMIVRETNSRLLEATVSPSSGTDGYSNSYQAGATVYGKQDDSYISVQAGSPNQIIMTTGDVAETDKGVIGTFQGPGPQNGNKRTISTQVAAPDYGAAGGCSLALISGSKDGTIAPEAQVIAGSTQLTMSGAAPTFSVLDALDFNTYGGLRKTFVLANNSGTLTSLTTIFTASVAARTYRVQGIIFINGTSGAQVNTEMVVPATASGQYAIVISRATTFVGSVAGGMNGSVGAAVSLGTSNGYIVEVSGVFATTGSGTWNFQVGSLTATGLVVAANSFLDLMPV